MALNVEQSRGGTVLGVDRVVDVVVLSVDVDLELVTLAVELVAVRAVVGLVLCCQTTRKL